jgi:hypothetical protein
MAVWRNFTTWNLDEDAANLPGPAEWYPNGYNASQHGFYLDADAQGAYRAWQMLGEEAEPADFKWVFPSNEKLTLLSPTKESEELLAQFYKM